MDTKIYQLYGIDTAMHLLRPGAKWEINNTTFTRWEDERECPTMEEVMETMEKIKAFEDSIKTVWTKEQREQLLSQQEIYDKAVNG
jgi:predicted GIY-YIG superfamily endonuclease